MLYLYDNALVEDLKQSFKVDDPDSTDGPVVGVISPDMAMNVVAQISDDVLSFPFVVLERVQPVSVKTDQVNFTRSRFGVDCVLDPDTDDIYREQALPVDLKYVLTAFATNQADMDEILRELMFKYTSQYFLHITIPYESKRDIAFGVSIDQGKGMDQQNGSSEYSQSGTLYRASMQLNCEGCVVVNYTPVRLQRNVYTVDAS